MLIRRCPRCDSLIPQWQPVCLSCLLARSWFLWIVPVFLILDLIVAGCLVGGIALARRQRAPVPLETPVGSGAPGGLEATRVTATSETLTHGSNDMQLTETRAATRTPMIEPTYTSLPTRTRFPTWTPRPTPTPRPSTPKPARTRSPTPTPRPTSTATPEVVIDSQFRADRTTINAGQCTHLRWDVDNIQAIYLDDQG